jgi:DNA-binding transcriptional LysR family regulator
MDLIDRVAHRLKLRDLRLLDVVVRSKSMARAAAQLHLTQPAVSKGISEMEHMLGVRLVERRRQGIEPTPHGRALLKSGMAIFDDLRQGVREIEHLSDPTAGEVRISSTDPIVAGLLSIVIARLCRQHPRISLYVKSTPIAILQQRTPYYRDLREREVDLVLGPIVDDAEADDLAVDFLFDDSLHVAASVNNPFARRRAVALADLIDESWCLPPLDSLVGARCVESFRVWGLGAPRKMVACQSTHLQLGLLATGRQFTMFPRSLLHFSGRRLGIKGLPIHLPVEPRRVGIVTLKHRAISPAARLFIQVVRDVAKPMMQRRAEK